MTILDSYCGQLGHGGCRRVRRATSRPAWSVCRLFSGVAGYAYGTSDGVTGSDGGGGRLIRVGAFDILVAYAEWYREVPLQ